MARKRTNRLGTGVVEIIERYDDVKRTFDPIYKSCFFCGRSIMVNNYEDGKPRTPKFNGKVICPWCDPRTSDRRAIRSDRLHQYKTVMSRLYLEKIVQLYPDTVIVAESILKATKMLEKGT